ncbi:MAG: cupin domain-containing protein, partial [Rhodospirillaceae bacterium]|nr:cupin domain-containing protein [Rhodospirillaceae bacterium]
MSRIRTRGGRAAAALLAAALLAVPPALAGEAGGEGVAVTLLLHQKMPNVPGKTMTVVAVDYQPGGFSAAHRHPDSGMVFAYAVSGAIRSQVEGEAERVYRAGESWVEPPGAHHVVSANASASEPARLIA